MKKNIDNKIYPLNVILCGKSSIDMEDNIISLFSVIDQIQINEKLFSNKNNRIPITHEVILFLKRFITQQELMDEIRMDIKISLVDPKGSVLRWVITPFIFQKEKSRMRLRVRLQDIVISEPGEYVYRIEGKEIESDTFVHIGEAPFEIVKTHEVSRK